MLNPDQVPVIPMRILAVLYRRRAAPEGTTQLRLSVAYIYIQLLLT